MTENRYICPDPLDGRQAMSTGSTATNEAVEKAARAMYADVEVGEWELGELETLLAYRRAARIALEAANEAMAAREVLIAVEKVIRPMPTLEQITEAIHRSDMLHEWRGNVCGVYCRTVYPMRADAVLALLNGRQS